RRAAGLAAEDARQRFRRIDRGLVIDIQRRGPVAARKRPRDVEQQARLHAGQVGVLVESLVDADTGPALAASFRRLVLAERDHARTEDRAIAGEHEIAFELPVIRHRILPTLPAQAIAPRPKSL